MKEAQNALSALSDSLSQNPEHFENLSALIYVRLENTFQADFIAPTGLWPSTHGGILEVCA